MGSTRRFIVLLTSCAVLAVSLAACSKASADPSAIEATIRSEEAAWLKAIDAGQLDATVSYYADDALLLAPNAPIARTKDEIRQTWMAVFASVPAGATVSTRTSTVKVAPSGDLAYTTGTIAIEANHTVDKGKFVDIWKKQVDGSWKAVIDIFNFDSPAPSTAK